MTTRRRDPPPTARAVTVCAAGVRRALRAEAGDTPLLFSAVTRTRYVVPLASPTMVHVSSPALVHAAPPGVAVARNPVIGVPPVLRGRLPGDDDLAVDGPCR